MSSTCSDRATGGARQGSCARSLQRLIDVGDVVVIVTDINSHGAVLAARKAMRRRGRMPLILRKCGISRFGQLLEAIKTHGAQAAASLAS